jgi:hypothetical protein
VRVARAMSGVRGRSVRGASQPIWSIRRREGAGRSGPCLREDEVRVAAGRAVEEMRRGPQRAVRNAGRSGPLLRGDEVRAAAGREIPGGSGRLGFSCGASRVKTWAGCGAG